MIYFKIKLNEVTQQQINFSTSRNINQTRKVFEEKGLLNSITWAILKTENNIFEQCSYFDNLIPYTKEEILDFIKLNEG